MLEVENGKAKIFSETQMHTFPTGLGIRKTFFYSMSNYGVRKDADIRGSIYKRPRLFLKAQTKILDLKKKLHFTFVVIQLINHFFARSVADNALGKPLPTHDPGVELRFNAGIYVTKLHTTTSFPIFYENVFYSLI